MDLHRRRWTRTRGPLRRGSALFTAGALVASLLLSSVAAGTALAADTAAKAPTETQAPNQWTNPNNAFSNDGVYATEGSNNDEQGYSGFGFTVPAGSIIDGITVKVEAKSTDSSGCDLQVALSWNGGSNYTSFKTADLTGADAVFTLGGATDTWGHVWDPTETNGNFRLKARNVDPGSSCTNGTTSVDYITVALSYTTIATPAVANPTITAGVCSQADFNFVIDQSGSIGETTKLANLKAGINGFVTTYTNAGGDGAYSATTFHDTSGTPLTSGYTTNEGAFTGLVGGLSSPSGYTPTGAAITAALANVGGARADVPKIMFVVTDGSPNRPDGGFNLSDPRSWMAGANAAIAASDGARSAGFTTLAVYLGAPDSTLPFGTAGKDAWVEAVMTATQNGVVAGKAYWPSDFSSLATTLLDAIGCKPDLHLDKSADKTELPFGGGVVNYTYTLTNTGNQALTGVTLKDEITGTSTTACSPITGPTGDTNANSKLDTTETWVYACSTTITQDTANTATADSTESAPATDTWSVTVAEPATLTLVKIVSGGQASASAWTLTATGPSILSGAGGATGEVSAGTYALSESTGPADYVPGSWSCDGGSQDGASVSLEPDESATCTITNTYNAPPPEPATLTLVKIVSGGQASASAWTLTATGPSILSGAGGATGEVSAGTYALSESTGPADYVPGSWSCDGGSQDGASVSLEPDESATCSITNTYNPPSPGYGTIIIEKQTAPNGSPEEFTFSSELSDGTFTLSDGETETFYELTPGTYGVEEINLPDGWTLASVTGDEGCRLGQPSVLDTAFVADVPQSGSLVSIYVGAGETVRCIFNNRGPEASPTPPPSVQIPRINVEKSASASTVPAGTAVTYTYKVTNTSIDALLTNIKVSDDKCSPATYVSGDDGDTFLQIGETWTYTCVATLTATTTNTVTATGAWRGQTVTDDAQATVTVTAGGVAGATATPRVTPPPTATAGSQDSGNPGSTLGVALAALALFGLVLGVLAPKPARARRRSR